MQTILKGVLESKSKLTTNELISELRAKRVDVLFNQASTGYVSGISYCYRGIIVKGAKLGNDNKWSAIKSIIGYDQERDRHRIHACPPKLQRTRETNVRSEHILNKLRAGTNMLKEIEQTHKEILSGIESYRILQKILDHAFTDYHSQLPH